MSIIKIENRPNGIVVSGNNISEVRRYAERNKNLDEKKVISLSMSMSPRRRKAFWGTGKKVYLIENK